MMHLKDARIRYKFADVEGSTTGDGTKSKRTVESTVFDDLVDCSKYTSDEERYAEEIGAVEEERNAREQKAESVAGIEEADASLRPVRLESN